MLTTCCISIANCIIDQWNHNGFALQRPNYGRKIALITIDVFIQKMLQRPYWAWNGYIFLPDFFIKCTIADQDQRLHAVTIELTSNQASVAPWKNANYSNFLISIANIMCHTVKLENKTKQASAKGKILL